MKNVNQTKFSLFFSDGKRLTYGNCLVACIASVLEHPIDEVPNIYTFYGLDNKEETENQLWFYVINLWLNKKLEKSLVKYSLDTPTQEEFVIMRGLSKRGRPHTCIYKNDGGSFSPYFDPHPTSEFLSVQHYYYTIS